MNTTLALGLMMTGLNVGEPPTSPVRDQTPTFAYPCCQGHTPAGHFRRTELISPYNVVRFAPPGSETPNVRDSEPIIRYDPQTLGFRVEGWKPRTTVPVHATPASDIPQQFPLIPVNAVSTEPIPEPDPVPTSSVTAAPVLGAHIVPDPDQMPLPEPPPPPPPLPPAMRYHPAPSLPAIEAEELPSVSELPSQISESGIVPVVATEPVTEPLPEPTLEPLPEVGLDSPTEKVWQVTYHIDPKTGDAIAQIIMPGTVTEEVTSEIPTTSPSVEKNSGQPGTIIRMSGEPLWLDSIP